MTPRSCELCDKIAKRPFLLCIIGRQGNIASPPIADFRQRRQDSSGSDIDFQEGKRTYANTEPIFDGLTRYKKMIEHSPWARCEM